MGFAADLDEILSIKVQATLSEAERVMKMLMSEKIAQLIEEMLNEGGGTLELKRNELATKVGCVPSQINYVITSRFGKDRGYIVESRRGGGGYVRITKLRMDKSTYLCHLLGAIGNNISESDAASILSALASNDLITSRERILISSCISATALEKIGSETDRATLRADILKATIFALISSIGV